MSLKLRPYRGIYPATSQESIAIQLHRILPKSERDYRNRMMADIFAALVDQAMLNKLAQSEQTISIDPFVHLSVMELAKKLETNSAEITVLCKLLRHLNVIEFYDTKAISYTFFDIKDVDDQKVEPFAVLTKAAHEFIEGLPRQEIRQHFLKVVEGCKVMMWQTYDGDHRVRIA